MPDASRWPFTLRALGEGPGAEISGLDLREPLGGAITTAIYDAFLAHQVLVFTGSEVPPSRQVGLARTFGAVQIHVMNQYHAAEHPELYVLSNLDAQGNPSGQHPDRGTLAWHTDGSWQRVTGQATFMYAVELPAQGGETHFCDMYSAYERLDAPWRARLEGLRAVHNLDFSRTRRHGEDPMSEAQRAAVPPVGHPIVRTHPETGRRCLYLGDHAESIEALAYEEGREMVEEVNALAVALGSIYEHRWQPHQLVVWDNRCLLHRATEYDTAQERRVIRRCTVAGETPAP